MNAAITESPDSTQHKRARLLEILQSGALLVLGFTVMDLFYAGTVAPGANPGVPGHDSFYHITMASILTKYGAMPEFPWLEYTYFLDQGDGFVSHHWGFHLLLFPFVKAAEVFTGDALTGGRWAVSAFFGINLVLFHQLLRLRRVPLHWLWIALFFLLPDQFFARHGFVRAIGPSLLFMQLILLGLFARRIWLAALAVGAYVHLYLGAVMFGPIMVAVYAAARMIGPKGDRQIPWKVILITAAAWGAGIVTYPYAAGIFEFLKLQVFGSGLSPDIEVGREWKPYSDAWFLLTMSAPLLVVWCAALLLRLRMGPRLSAEELAVMVLQFMFLMLTFKARRFIEYWPPFCLLSAAYTAAPPLAALLQGAREWLETKPNSQRTSWEAAGLVVLAVVCALSWSRIDGQGAAQLMLANWKVWAAPAALVTVVALARQGGTVALRPIVSLAGGALVLGAMGLTIGWSYGDALGPARSSLPVALTVTLGLSFVLAAWASRTASANGSGATRVPWTRTAAVVLLGVLIPTATLALGSKGFSSAVRQLRCYYDLDALASTMDYLQANSAPGDVVFTDDWDIFPPYFYFNQHNHYIVGLDPKFTHQRDPDLWNRYVKLSRGQVPGTIQLASNEGDDRAPVALEDIREYFGARFVITDRDHRPLAEKLADRREFVELVYPEHDYDSAKDAPYLIFRVRSRDEERSVAAELATEAERGRSARSPLGLGSLDPVSATQGWGDLEANRTVDGNRIRLNRVSYQQGLGTHAPSRLLYDVPQGYAWFEAIVGIDDETDGEGSVIASISLDGRRVYESPTLRGGGKPATVRIPIEGARQIQLEAETTADGNRFDHVCWADARFIPND